MIMQELNPAYYQPDFLEDVKIACPHLYVVLYRHTAQAKLIKADFINSVLGQILKEHYTSFLKAVGLSEPPEMTTLRRRLNEEWESGKCYTKEGIETFFCPRFIAQRDKNMLHLMTADMVICVGREYDADFYFMCPRWPNRNECWLKWYLLTASETM